MSDKSTRLILPRRSVVSGLAGMGALGVANRALAQAAGWTAAFSGGGGGTSSTRYSFAGTRFRPFSSSGAGNGVQVAGSNLYQLHQIISASPDYATDNWYFYFGNFTNYSSATNTYQSSPPIENPMGNTTYYEGLSFQVGGAVYSATGGYPVSSAGVVGAYTTFASQAGNSPPGIPVASGGGILIGPVTIGGAGMAASTTFRVRVAFNVPTSGYIGNGVKNSNIPSTGFAQADSTIQGATSQASLLTATSNLSNNGTGFNTPMFGVAQGGDGRPAMLVIGDSIGYGINESAGTSVSPTTWSSRGAFGFLDHGLDDNTTSKRLASANLCCPGQGPNQWQTLANWQLKYNALKAVHDTLGDWPFDHILSEHGTNSITTSPFATMMQAYWTTMTSNLGNKPIHQMALLSYPDSSSDGYTTTAGQTPSTANAYPSGNRWTFNSTLASGGFSTLVSSFFEPWKATAVSPTLGANCDRLVNGSSLFQTTLAAAYSGSGSISLNAAPPLGAHLSFQGYSTGNTANGFGALATSVSGAGPYTVGLSVSGGSFKALSSGVAVQEVVHDTGGLHPSPYSHATRYPASVIAWKRAQGWV